MFSSIFFLWCFRLTRNRFSPWVDISCSVSDPACMYHDRGVQTSSVRTDLIKKAEVMTCETFGQNIWLPIIFTPPDQTQLNKTSSRQKYPCRNDRWLIDDCNISRVQSPINFSLADQTQLDNLVEFGCVRSVGVNRALLGSSTSSDLDGFFGTCNKARWRLVLTMCE